MNRTLFTLLIISSLVLPFACSRSARAEEGKALFLTGAEFDPLVSAPVKQQLGPYELSAKAFGEAEVRYVIVQFKGEITPELTDKLREQGTDILGYVPNDAYLVRLPQGKGMLDGKSSQFMASVRWQGAYLPAYKIEPSLKQKALDGTEPDESVKVHVVLFKGESIEGLWGEIQDIDPAIRVLTVKETYIGEGRATLETPKRTLANVISALARMQRVLSVSQVHDKEVKNDNSVWGIQSGDEMKRTTPLFNKGLTGHGQVYGASDTGIDVDHRAFRKGGNHSDVTHSNTTQPPSINITDPNNKIMAYYVLGSASEYDYSGQHGTNTTGCAVGDDYTNLATSSSAGRDSGDGMAPAAQIVFQDVGNSSGGLVGIPFDLTDMFQQAYDSGARVHSNSWGLISADTSYTTEAIDCDEAMWRLRDFTIFFSAGNSGPSQATLNGAGATAKNTVVVGSSVNAIARAGRHLSEFSSHGLTSDSRIKPDVVAPGEVHTPSGDTTHDNSSSGSVSTRGTSFSCPTTAGAALLVREYFQDGYYPTGAANASDSRNPSNALVKAVLINSARNMAGGFTATSGSSGAKAYRPTGGQGWGRIVLDDALFFSGDQRELKVLDDVFNGRTTITPPSAHAAITHGETHTFNLTSVSNIEPLKITLVWSDVRRTTTGSGPTLVNNLDLKVTDPNSTVYLGNANFSGGWSSSGGAADSNNTVENVFIKDAVSGTYTIEVIGTNVNGNGDTGILAQPGNEIVSDNRQGYALIATGNFSSGAVAKIKSVSSASASQGDTLSVTITGENTNFSGSSAVSFTNAVGTTGDISVNSVSHNSSTSLSANITVADTAFPTSYDIRVTTGTEVARGSDVFSVDLSLGTGLNSSDDGLDLVSFTGGRVFRFFGTDYPSIYVNANGNLTFGSGDSDWSESVSEFEASPPRIAVLWDDFNPAANSANSSQDVFYRQLTDTFVVTWSQVPEFGSTVGTENTFQVILHLDNKSTSGTVEMRYIDHSLQTAAGVSGSQAGDGIVGLSKGDGSTATEINIDVGSASTTGGLYEQFTGLSTNGSSVFDPMDVVGKSVTFTPNGDNAYTVNGSGQGLFVEVSRFVAVGLNAKVQLEWSTEFELDTAGFNILRGLSRSGPFLQVNDALMSSKGGEFGRADYSYIDVDVVNGVTYYYTLQEVELDGDNELHGPVWATPGVIAPIVPFDSASVAPLPLPIFEWFSDLSVRLRIEISSYEDFGRSVAVRASVPKRSDHYIIPKKIWKRAVKLARANGNVLCWRVVARSRGADDILSHVNSFTVQPSQLSLISPGDGANRSPDLPFRFLWRGVGVEKAVVEICADVSFSQRETIRIKPRRSENSVEVSKRALRRVLALAAENGGPLYWRVIGREFGTGDAIVSDGVRRLNVMVFSSLDSY